MGVKAQNIYVGWESGTCLKPILEKIANPTLRNVANNFPQPNRLISSRKPKETDGKNIKLVLAFY